MHHLRNCVIYYFVKDDSCFDGIRSSLKTSDDKNVCIIQLYRYNIKKF
jgi:hypothetical protein